MCFIVKYTRIVILLQSMIFAIDINQSLAIKHTADFEDTYSVRHTVVEPSNLRNFNGPGTTMDEENLLVYFNNYTLCNPNRYLIICINFLL